MFIYRRRRSMARCLLENSLQHYGLCQYSPSILASCVLSITEHLLKDGFMFFQQEDASLSAFRNCLNDLKELTEASVDSVHDWYDTDTWKETIGHIKIIRGYMTNYFWIVDQLDMGIIFLSFSVFWIMILYVYFQNITCDSRLLKVKVMRVFNSGTVRAIM